MTTPMHLQLVQQLIDSGVLRSRQIVAAFRAVDRAYFVPHYIGGAETYLDHPLPIGYGQTISQPSTVAFMLELLQPQAGDKVLDVGTGSGWTSALLGYIVGDEGYVYGVEIVPELVEVGRKNVEHCLEANVMISPANPEQLGNPQCAPYDRILVSASATEIPAQLVAQLKIGGVLVLPVKNDVVFLRKHKDGQHDIRSYPGFVFVPLVS